MNPRPASAIPLNCPRCPRALFYIKSTASMLGGELDTHFYSCPVHGGWKLLPTGGIVPYSFTD